MEELKSKAGNFTDSVTDYIQTYYKLTLLKIADKTTGIVAIIAVAVIVLFVGIFVLLFSGIALGIWLGGILGSYALGYLLVAGLFLLIIVIVLLLRKRLIFPAIRNAVTKKIYE